MNISQFRRNSFLQRLKLERQLWPLPGIVRRKAGRCFEWTGSSDKNLQILSFSLHFEGSQKINLHSHDMINNVTYSPELPMQSVSAINIFFPSFSFAHLLLLSALKKSDSGSAQEAGNAFVSNDSWSWQKATVRIAIPGEIISTSFFFGRFIDNHREKSQNHGYQTAIH